MNVMGGWAGQGLFRRRRKRGGGTPADRTNTGPPSRSHPHGYGQVSWCPCVREGGRVKGGITTAHLN